ncbi:MAG: ATP-binding protein [Synechococcales cyanobacterium C42_A2020_086]|jgi:hypothetical protein|nr:ATP-binding protein [Synechococcales cyanobacterium C42_A2020_086]
MFITNIKGTLISLQEDEQSRYQCEIWFEYTRKNMEKIREGALLAVPNFSSNRDGYRYNILEVVSLLPVHYGLGENASGYPGFVKEAAKSAFTDWRDQEDEVREDTTQIRVLAIPTNLEVDENNQILEESNLPMTGADIYPIDNDLTRKILNRELDPNYNNVIVVGNLIREPNIEVYALADELLQVHFGIFGFTGAGKSNLLSTLVSKLYQESKEPTNFVFFDLMSEYATLVLDLLVQHPGAYLIGLGSQTFPGEVGQFLAGDKSKLDAAAEAMAKTALLPKALRKYSKSLTPIYRQLLTDGKIKVYQRVSADKSLGSLILELWQESKSGKIAGDDEKKLDPLIQELGGIETKFSVEVAQGALEKIAASIQDIKGANGKKSLENLQSKLSAAVKDFSRNPPLPQEARVNISWMVEQLNKKETKNLFIIQAHNPDELRDFSSWLGDAAYEERRSQGLISPLVSFVFDEADEFIPQQESGSYKNSTDIAMTLARRGRKFGLGIGIATQRITYLNTSILAQPHTYFISKLPRKSDRERIRDAFGLGDEMFRQTFKFKKGDWLLVSYDATGVEAVPIPIHTPDANKRLADFLEGYDAELVSDA